MRKISLGQILVFSLLATCIVSSSVTITWLVGQLLPQGDFRGLALLGLGVLTLYVAAIVAFRLWLKLMPIPIGPIEQRSKAEFSYHVYLLFFLIFFYPVMRGGFVPVPIMRIVYLALGARLGKNTYSSGIILDPRFVTTGDDCIIGQFALLIPHVIEGRHLAHYPITLGHNVTIGAHAVVLSGVTIGDDAIVATGAIVPKGTTIAAGEVWGGVPARRLGAEARNPC